jgi:hypothetical protein
MHAYASDSHDRKVVPLVVGGVAVLIAYVYALIVARWQITVPWWVEAPSIMSTYALGHWLFENVLWRKRILGLRLSQIPDYAGTWYGVISSSHNAYTQSEGIMYIRQTWSKICVEFESGTSRSFSRMAALNLTPGATEGLVYEYVNEPRGDAPTTMHAHPGFAAHRMSPDGQTMEVDYYTGRGRETHGTMRLRWLCRDRLSREQAAEKFCHVKGN